jgi:peptidoglycan/xylan/chitin deacetylase (PgdA/CDA1 family)
MLVAPASTAFAAPNYSKDFADFGDVLCKRFNICDPVVPPAPDPTPEPPAPDPTPEPPAPDPTPEPPAPDPTPDPDPIPDPGPTPNPNPKPYDGSGMVTFTFDDGLISTYTLAAPILSEYGYPGTAYVYTKAQNEQYYGFMHWDEVSRLQNEYSWEVGSHAYSHDDLTTLPSWKAEWEIKKSKDDLEAHGINVESFATPYGAHNTDIVNFAARHFSSHRSAWNLPNTFPVNDYYLKARPVLPDTDPETVISWINEAQANDQWLILYFHALTEGIPQAEWDDYNTEDFRSIVNHTNEIEIPVVTTKDGVRSFASGDNEVFNGTFEHGYNGNAENWIRSNDSDVKVIRWNTGVYPESRSLAWIDGDSSRQRSISTYGIDVNDWQDYRLKAFFRITNYVSGSASVWISEFDENYNYVGGQWLGGFSNNYLGTRAFDYNPTNGTSKIEIYFISHADSLIKQEVDNVELRAK